MGFVDSSKFKLEKSVFVSHWLVSFSKGIGLQIAMLSSVCSPWDCSRLTSYLLSDMDSLNFLDGL